MRKISELVITLKNEKGEGEGIEIQTKKAEKARKNLGHWNELERIKVPKQFPALLKTTITTSEAIFTTGVTQQEALMLYQGVYRPKLEYLLGQIFLTNKQVKKIESVSLPKVIVKCGYYISMGLDIRGGPKELGGARFGSFKNITGATTCSIS